MPDPPPSPALSQHTTRPEGGGDFCVQVETIDQLWGTVYGDPHGPGLISRVGSLEAEAVRRSEATEKRGIWVRFWVPLLFTLVSLILAAISIFSRGGSFGLHRHDRCATISGRIGAIGAIA